MLQRLRACILIKPHRRGITLIPLRLKEREMPAWLYPGKHQASCPILCVSPVGFAAAAAVLPPLLIPKPFFSNLYEKLRFSPVLAQPHL